jgi:hypothetical protein
MKRIGCFVTQINSLIEQRIFAADTSRPLVRQTPRRSWDNLVDFVRRL